MLKRLILGVIRFYQYITAYYPPVCRFYPSCSEYSYEAINKHGIVKGSGLAIMRILKCNRFHPGGYDPVPEVK